MRRPRCSAHPEAVCQEAPDFIANEWNDAAANTFGRPARSCQADRPAGRPDRCPALRVGTGNCQASFRVSAASLLSTAPSHPERVDHQVCAGPSLYAPRRHAGDLAGASPVQQRASGQVPSPGVYVDSISICSKCAAPSEFSLTPTTATNSRSPARRCRRLQKLARYQLAPVVPGGPKPAQNIQ